MTARGGSETEGRTAFAAFGAAFGHFSHLPGHNTGAQGIDSVHVDEKGSMPEIGFGKGDCRSIFSWRSFHLEPAPSLYKQTGSRPHPLLKDPLRSNPLATPRPVFSSPVEAQPTCDMLDMAKMSHVSVQKTPKPLNRHRNRKKPPTEMLRTNYRDLRVRTPP